jgi:threonine/homoserine/homoserine lactone efflux protein
VSGLGVLPAVGLGFGLGAVAGMPLGVINIAIVEAATAGRRRFAEGLGLGGAAADAIQAGLAFGGVGRVMTADPALVRGLAIAAAVAIIAYAVMAWRRRGRAAAPRIGPQPGPETRRQLGPQTSPQIGPQTSPQVGPQIGPQLGPQTGPQVGPQTGPTTGDDVPRMRGVAAGFVLTLPNPGALGAWVAVAAAVWRDATPYEAALIAGGVVTGSALWFTTLARWVDRTYRRHPGARPRSRTLELFPRVALVVLIAIALAGVIRAL